ncbi:hypothetical protein E6C76_08690 [Pseudothauera nasutitermitis]|uniref:Uncharacterized protein n=1 Tax=Pseudothauera nasutitermitis TaxID=2565930 RepID=A0A4S4B1R4_9RHOO|nr:hypothetical protein [Pseudothauera nasutitermitis]THF65637.1 hypothetical protein E6C76_08690 [Pseudothauera nasutitermitis]
METTIDWSQIMAWGTDRADLPNALGQQVQLLSKVQHPQRSDFAGKPGDEAVEIPERMGERLDLLAKRNETFDPAVSMLALQVTQRVLLTAVKDMGARRVVETILGEKTELCLAKDWAEWFEEGAYWPDLLVQHWRTVLKQAVEQLAEWAREQGSEEVDGAQEAVQELASTVMRLTPREVIPQAVFEKFFEKTDGPEGEQQASEW